MARQDLAYQIAVNDAELRLATQHVAAFNAELELSTVAGSKLSTSLRATGRQAAQVGNFFTRNLTIPLALAGAAAAKSAGQFDVAVGKIQGLTGATVAQTAQLRAAALSLSSHELTQGPTALANALFFLKSVGLSTGQSIAALKPISEAASGGMGDIASVAEAVTSAMDAYGFSNLKAATAVAIMIQTVTKGKIPPEQLAGAIGKVVPVANAMGISFDQVGASLASLTRQGLNAGLAATGLRQVFATLLKPSNQTNEALASIGTNAEAVATSMKKIGVLPTLLTLRKQLGDINLDSKTLVSAFNGNATAIDKVKTASDGAGASFAKLFPNIRALTAALILTGPRNKANQGIFDSLKAQLDPATAAATAKRAIQSQQNTPVGQLNTQISELKANTQGIGDSFLKVGAKVLGFVNGFLSFVHNLDPNMRGLIKDFGIFLLAIGPGVALFGRLTQAASFAVKVFGTWQVRAQEAAQALAGVNIAEDKMLIATRKATTVFEESMTQMVASAGRVAKSIDGIGAAQARAAGAAVAVTGTTGGVIPSGGATARPSSGLSVDDQLAKLQVRRATQATAAAQTYAGAQAATIAAQERVNLLIVTGATGYLGEAKAELASAKASESNAAAKLAEADALKTVLFQDELLLKLQGELVVAQQEQIRFGAANATISERQSAAQVASLEQQLALRQRILAGQQLAQVESARISGLGNTGSFAVMDAKAQQLQASAASSAIVTQGRIARTGWSTAIEGMKSASKLGFDFIALTFGIDVAQKIIGNSHQTKIAVTHDLLDINKAGVGAFAAITAAALALGPKIAAGFTSLRGGAGVFETLGVAALGWRAKIALVIASIFGLQKAGIGLESVFNAVSVVMLARFAAVRLGIIESGAAFGPWGIAFAVAATVIVAKADSITKGIYDVGAALGITSKQLSTFGVANFNTTAKMLEELKGATTEAQKRAIVEKVIAASNADSADKAKFVAQFLGQATADQLTAADTLKRSLETSISGFDKLPPKIKALVTLLQQTGKPLAAQALASGEQAKEQASQIAAAAALLRDLGESGPAAILQASVTSTKAAQTTLTNIFKDVQTQITTAFDNHTARMLDSFDEQTSAILNSFDAQTTKLEDNLKVQVKVPKLNETFTVTVNGKTPAERELAALDLLQQKQNFQRDILSANQGLSEARQVGDPVAVQAALQKVQDAENERKQFILNARASTERTAADAALKTGKTNLDNQRAQQRQGISDARDAARRDLEAARAVQETQIKNALNAQKKLLDNGKIGIGTFYTDILKIMKSNNVSISQAGADGGEAYTKAFSFALNLLKGQVKATLATVAGAAKTAATTVKKNLSLLDQVAAAIQGNTPGLSVMGVPSASTIEAQTNSTAGVPTRPAILDALVAKDALIGLTPPQRAKAISQLPQNGTLTFQQYYNYLQKLPSKARTNLSTVLGEEGFFRAAGGGVVPGGPPWHSEGPQYYTQAYDFFHPYSKGAPYTTKLAPADETAFREWIKKSGLSAYTGYSATQRISDYDYRGFWQGDPSAVGTWRPGKHFPDIWKEPYDTTFSRESKYATRDNPFDWRGNNLVNLKTGRVIFSPRAEGGKVPGSGGGDTVPAMLTPGEVVLNRNQQATLGGMLGMPGIGPHGLFSFIKSRGGRFAGGGVVPPEDPNLARLLEALARNAQRRSNQFNAGQSGIPTSATIAGRNTSGAGFVRNLVPTNIESLVNHTTKGLTRLQKISLEGTLAQAQAHPLATGLLSATATGTKIGSTPHAIAGSGQLGAAGDTFIVEGDLTIPLSSSGNGDRDAENLLGAMRKKVRRAPRRRTGRPLRGTLGVA